MKTRKILRIVVGNNGSEKNPEISLDKLHHVTLQACTAREWHVHSLPTRVQSLLHAL
jgi:hypothetical protein